MWPFVSVVCGWVTISQARFGGQIDAIRAQLRGQATPNEPHVQQKLGYLWTKPASSDDTTGLGGGITWQWDPDLCGSLLPRLHRSQLYTCDDLKAATRRAFATWASNHKDIRFVDVTEPCAAIGQPHEGCELAEVFVTELARPHLNADTEGPPTEGMPAPPPPSPSPPPTPPTPRRPENSPESAAAARLQARISETFRYTNGELAYSVEERGAFSAEDQTFFATNADGAAPVQRAGSP